MSSENERDIDCLQRHSGLSRDIPDERELGMLIFRMKQNLFRTVDETQIVMGVQEILQCIDRLNRAKYAERLGTPHDDRRVADRVAYPISELLRMLTAAICDIEEVESPQKVRRTIIESAEQLAVAWSAFMAGDIEDILAEVQITNRFRGRETRWPDGRRLDRAPQGNRMKPEPGMSPPED